MPCLQPSVCTGPGKDGPTCEVCYMEERVAKLQDELDLETENRKSHEQAHWYEVGINNRYRYLLVRCRRELRYMMADISAGKIPHDGDGLHELLRDLDTALIP